MNIRYCVACGTDPADPTSVCAASGALHDSGLVTISGNSEIIDVAEQAAQVLSDKASILSKQQLTAAKGT